MKIFDMRGGGRRAFFVALLSLGAGGCSQGILDPHGPIAAAEKTIMLNSFGIMLTIVVPTILATLGVAWWFRASNTRARYRPTWDYSGKIEIVVWSVPAMTILLLGGIAWISSHDLDPARPLKSEVPPVEVQVVALDWKWLFIYPREGVASVNRLVVPAGRPVKFELTSAGVMNSFFVPQLGGQIYTMSGMTTRLNLQADQPGSYPGLSSQFSGDGFSGMRFSLDAVSQDAFQAWLSTARRGGGVLDAQGYTALAAPSRYVPPRTFGVVDRELFRKVVGREPVVLNARICSQPRPVTGASNKER
ncbi:MAG: ubiquinol oxidase subunit II [Caulobacter sp.]|nr:ubiquinol oxidase subunit II [Caulobacter sp.]